VQARGNDRSTCIGTNSIAGTLIYLEKRSFPYVDSLIVFSNIFKPKMLAKFELKFPNKPRLEPSTFGNVNVFCSRQIYRGAIERVLYETY